MDAGAAVVRLLKQLPDIGGYPRQVIPVLVSVERLAQTRDRGPVFHRLKNQMRRGRRSSAYSSGSAAAQYRRRCVGAVPAVDVDSAVIDHTGEAASGGSRPVDNPADAA